MATIKLPTVEVGDRLTTGQKLFLIIQENPDKRNSYDLLTNEFYRRNPQSKITKKSLEREIRFIQYGLGIYPPSNRVRRLRKNKQAEIIAKKKKKSLFSKFMSIWK